MWYAHVELLGFVTHRTTYSVNGNYRQVLKMANDFWLISTYFAEDTFFFLK